MKKKHIIDLIPALILSLVLLFLWQVIVNTFAINPHILPTPLGVVNGLIINWDVLYPHAIQTITEAVIGLILATILGILTALIIDSSILLKKMVSPLLIISQTIPMIALAPLLLLWFGFELTPKILMVILYCFFPITIAFASGLSSADPDLIKLLKSMGATKWQIVRMAKIPWALPQFFSGLKIAATYAVTAAIVGEYVGGYQGLGVYMQTMAHSYATTLVFGGIAVTAILSLFLFWVVALIEHLTTTRYKNVV